MQLNSFKDIFAKYKNKHWLIAFSGGADSRVLLAIATNFREFALSIKAIYVHHHLQSVADEWAVFCGKECAKLNIDFIVEHVQVKDGGSVEANAREARYAAFKRYMTADTVIFTAHHQDDLLETMLLALVRGSGLNGLATMPLERPFATGILARPLLNVSRAEIEEFCARSNLDYVTDPTNNKTDYDRNYLRHEVIPKLKTRFPQILKSAFASANALNHCKQVYTSMLNTEIEHYVVYKYGVIGFDFKRAQTRSLTEKDPSVFIAELLREFMKARLNVNLNEGKLNELMLFAMLSNDNHAQCNISNYIAFCYEGILFIAPPAQTLISTEVSLKIGMTVSLLGYSISLLPVTQDNDINDANIHSNVAPLNASVTLDTRRYKVSLLSENDLYTLKFMPQGQTRLCPQKRNHSQVLKNLWKEYKIPALLRPFYPLVMMSDTPIALAGVFACKLDESKLTDNTNRKWCECLLEIKRNDK